MTNEDKILKNLTVFCLKVKKTENNFEINI